MSLLNMLGLLALLSIAALIIIYLIRPNYQQKFVSSTYVWKLSLKYRKKRIPINYLRNILIIICQVLILTSLALIISQPVIRAPRSEDYVEKIAVIDASANMTAVNGQDDSATSRFDRAVEKVRELSDEVFESDGKITVILAGIDSSVEMRRVGAEDKDDFYTSLSALKCTNGSADMEGAMALAEEVLSECVEERNVAPEVLLYTATQYISEGDVTVVDVSESGEWNAAILGGVAQLNESYSYNFSVDVAVYGKDTPVRVGFDIYGVNGASEGSYVRMYKTATCINDEPVTVTLNTSESSEEGDDYSSDEGPSSDVVYSYSYVRVYIASVDNTVAEGFINDSIASDDSFYFYGGTQHTLKVQYSSSLYNPFINGIISSWRNTLAANWTIEPTEVGSTDGEAALEGFDVYIFEHVMPEKLPDDGLVILIDPSNSSAPAGSGLSFGEPHVAGEDERFTFASGETSHPVLNNIKAEDIWVTKYTSVTADSDYQELMFCGGEPVFLLKDEIDEKVLVLSVDINRSNLSMLPGFSLMMVDIFSYFFPGTISNYMYEVGDSVSFNSVSPSMDLYTPQGGELPFSEFPASYYLDVQGTYTLTQSLLSGKSLSTSFFVKIPAGESNVKRIEDYLVNPYKGNEPVKVEDYDLLIYFASALVALLFIEWWLQSRNQF